MEGINCSSVDVFSLRLGAFLEKVIFCIAGLIGSLETTLNAGFQAVQGQTYKSALLKAANFGQNVSWYTSVFLYYTFQNCVWGHIKY